MTDQQSACTTRNLVDIRAVKIARARVRYELATSEFREVLEGNCQDGLPSAEGLQAILKARFLEAAALSEYLQALRASEEPA